MASVAESSDPNPNSEHPRSKSIGDAYPWIDYAVDQARLLRRRVEDDVESFIGASQSRLSEIRSTSSAHTMQTLAMMQDTLQEVKSKYDAYEDIFFKKIKEGIEIAALHPMLTAGVVTGSSLIVLKRPRRFLYYNIMRLLMTEESMLSRADAKVKELRKSDLLKAESEKLERRAQLAEEEMLRGRTKLRQAGKQIQSVIHSAYKIERQAGGLKEVLRELPRREASRFRSQHRGSPCYAEPSLFAVPRFLCSDGAPTRSKLSHGAKAICSRDPPARRTSFRPPPPVPQPRSVDVLDRLPKFSLFRNFHANAEVPPPIGP